LIESLDMAQATLELVTRSRRTPFVSYQHILNSHAWWYVAEVLAWARRYRAAVAPNHVSAP
jgi:hypothetical protein